jgi:hypothetical protein
MPNDSWFVSILKEKELKRASDSVVLIVGASVLGILDRVLDGPAEQTHARCVQEREDTLRVLRECGWKG